jgi:hypothetical protein
MGDYWTKVDEQCPCGHSYGAHRILGGPCISRLSLQIPRLWQPCPCPEFGSNQTMGRNKEVVERLTEEANRRGTTSKRTTVQG